MNWVKTHIWIGFTCLNPYLTHFFKFIKLTQMNKNGQKSGSKTHTDALNSSYCKIVCATKQIKVKYRYKRNR